MPEQAFFGGKRDAWRAVMVPHPAPNMRG
jgi:hypothetical protein